MFALIRHPFISISMKFLARVTMGGVWGIALSPFELDVRLGFGAVLAVLAAFLSYSFVAFDRLPLSASRLALYGLVIAGEYLAVGCVVLAALGAFQGQPYTYAMMVSGFGSALFTVYGMTVLYRDNISKAAGSNP